MNFRHRLSKTVLDSGTKGYRRWYTPGLFEKYVAPLLPKNLTILSAPPEKGNNYNCFLFALGLQEDQKIIKASKGFIYSGFVKSLLDAGVLVITRAPRPGDLVIYSDSRHPEFGYTHAGRLSSRHMIISKWSWGPLMRHRLLDVPDFYGSRILYIKKVSPAKARTLFWQFHRYNRKSA